MQTILPANIYLLKCSSLIGVLCLLNEFINNLSDIFTENSKGSKII